MKFKGNRPINFLNFVDIILINSSRKIIISLILFLIIVSLFRFNLGSRATYLNDQIVQLTGDYYNFESRIAELDNIISPRKNPKNIYTLFEKAVGIISETAVVNEIDYTHPDLILYGRAHDEDNLNKLGLNSEQLNTNELDISLLRTDYRENPAFILKIKPREKGG